MDLKPKRNTKNLVILLLLFIIFFLTFIFSISMGSLKISFNEVIKILFKTSSFKSGNYQIVWNIRFPRAVGALIGGSALSVSGLLLQVLFKNPIVEPYVLGISSGATLFVALVMLSGISFGFNAASPFLVFSAALIGSILIMLIVILFANKVKNVVTLLVIGIMVGYICSAVTNVLSAFADKQQLQFFTMWTLGSFSGFTLKNIYLLFFIGVPTLLASFLIIKPLNAFLLGEAYAKSLGIKIQSFRTIVIIISSILSAIVTAFAGPIAFIGLAVPHITRLIFKSSNNMFLIPGTILMGGIITSLCDVISRTVLAPTELPISAVTSFIGAPIVIFLILRRRTLS
ncbi:FecCD family ABC transporter permease [Clostridium felsineum]|uniref:Hemin transport system permease protein HmuU n=1 Tax=Clostridium felsineum TaxID=36839 RepID=A0A1S8MCI0_9CLOT|nr:iron ABC transporter permease [Clostridium felsineum]URZ07332.1 Hemin transport system permease protein HmuU [Clostridium felsineum]URZ12363.1 Hemin transport system permease protein HmuU [Clostridium felsineum]